MNSISSLFAAVLLMAGFSSCQVNAVTIGNVSKPVAQRYEVAPFNSVASSSCIDVVYSQGPVKATVIAPKELLPYIELSVKDGELCVGFSRDIHLNFLRNPVLRAEISSPRLDKITTQGSGDVVLGNISTDRFVARTFGSGDIDAKNIDASDVVISSMGSGDVKVGKVTAKTLNISSMGSGDISCAADVSSLAASTSGSGDLRISGSAGKASLSSSGSGDIDIRSLKSSNLSSSSMGSGDILR